MSLHLTKQLKPKTSTRLQLLVKNLGFLRNFQDGPYLKEALKQKVPIWQVATNYSETLLTLELEPLLARDNFNLIRNESNGLFFNKVFRPSEKMTFKIVLVRNTYPRPGTSVVALVENSVYNITEMALDPIQGGTAGNLFALASYFYNKPAAYKKIHAFLMEKSSLLETQLSKEYVAALIELFSLQATSAKMEPYSLPATFSKEEKGFEYLPEIKSQAIFSVAFFYRPTKIIEKVLNQEVEIYLTLNKSGELVYDIIPVYGSAIFEPQQVLTFIKKNTIFWLEEMEALVAFGLKIVAIPNLKTKILVSNI